MLNNLCQPVLACAALAFLLMAGDARAESWWSRIFSTQPYGFHTAQELEKATTVAVGEFTGATGGTASQAMTGQLKNSDGIQVLSKGARFMLTGSSVGGRITGRLADRKGKVIFERTYAAPGLDDNVRSLADDIIFAVTGHPGQATSRIAFVSDVTGTKQVYLCDTDGSQVEQVTHQAFGAVSPAIAADGSMIAYTGYGTGFPNVVVVDMGAGQERQMASTPGMNTSPSFSPDGRRLALTMSFVGNPEIFVLDLNNGHAICVTESIGVPSSPSWHPDGRRLIFSANEGLGPQLYLVDTATEQSAVRWATGYNFTTDPEWSPDGSQVAFTTHIGDDWAVVVQGYPSGLSKVIQRSGAQHPTWSPDGRSLAYVQHGQLWVQDIASSKRHSIISGRGDISEPRWMR
ncbi:MAG: TolB protein [Verrucomicrobiaceae bacterium]|nr:TolB protein [Verrucomicrobiaceae bacterium]